MSTTTRPVTQTAEVAVNSAVSHGALWPLALAHGSISSTVPTPMVARNARASTAAGWVGKWFFMRAERGKSVSLAGRKRRSAAPATAFLTRPAQGFEGFQDAGQAFFPGDLCL